MPQTLRFSSLKELNDEVKSLHKLIMKSPSARLIMQLAEAMPATAKDFLKKGDQEQAYIAFKRFTHLAMDIGRLPDADQEACKTIFDSARVMKCIKQADALAGILERRYKTADSVENNTRCEPTEVEIRSQQQQNARMESGVQPWCFLLSCFSAYKQPEADNEPQVYQRTPRFSSINDLNNQVQIMHNLIMRTNPQSIMENAEKMLARAEEFLNKGDHEQAYIQFTRFTRLAKDISQLPDVDKEVCKSMFNKSSVGKCTKNAKKLSKILEKRYKTATEEKRHVENTVIATAKPSQK
ncbi:Hypothetical predicted protein [Cloeon dipterum]|uniref:USP8 dimerisation domain-containing protein n=1 Tax=Cloeon dipterum TaxID=197152 RepID=A0A8S1C779_9INSE|nr:Hypothetical predicted protein [Cloeon dipterum]